MANEYPTTKQCKSCGLEKPKESFYKILGGKYLRGECKSCMIEKAVEREKASPTIRATRKAWQDKNRASLAEYMRAWAASNKEKTKGYVARYVAANPEKAAAKKAIALALRSGLIERQPCWVCGKEGEAHHPHYGEPLMVSWLCRDHHKGLHAEHAASTSVH